MKEQTLWSGGRLDSEMDREMIQLNNSLWIDQRMAKEDVQGSLAWANAIFEAGVLSRSEYDSIISGLKQISEEFSNDSFQFKSSDEDIHTAVERRLTEIIGPAGGKIHTGRSRNDQVVTDFRLWIKNHISEMKSGIETLQNAFLDRAEQDMGVILPGYTHFQQAQPILLSHWWLSHFWALERDKQRLTEAQSHADISPLGCGALAGSTLPIDRFKLAKDLGFPEPAPNSLDAVSDRDFVCDFLYEMAMIAVHMSRCAEALILYSTTEFGFITLSDRYSTGSSLMPQKKNPDSLELIRGKCGSQIGLLQAMLSTLKGLPSAYDKDLQEDKVLFFQSWDNTLLLMKVLTGVIGTLHVNADRCRQAVDTQAFATDVADYLVKKGVPFREAHHIVGKVVKRAEAKHLKLTELSLADWKEISSLFDNDLFRIFSLESAVNARTVWGGTASEQVLKQLAYAKSKMNTI